HAAQMIRGLAARASLWPIARRPATLPAGSDRPPPTLADSKRAHGPGHLRSPRPAGRAGGRLLRAPAAAAREVRRGGLLLVPPGRGPPHSAAPRARAPAH